MITIRRGVLTDLECIVEFQIAMAWETESITLDRDTVTCGLWAFFDYPTKGTNGLAERDGQRVGGLLILPEWSDWRNGTVLWIHSVYVVPEARKNGVFQELFRTIQAEVEKSPALKGLRLYVDKTNEKAQRIYTGLGMRNDHYEMFEWLKE